VNQHHDYPLAVHIPDLRPAHQFSMPCVQKREYRGQCPSINPSIHARLHASNFLLLYTRTSSRMTIQPQVQLELSVPKVRSYPKKNLKTEKKKHKKGEASQLPRFLSMQGKEKPCDPYMMRLRTVPIPVRKMRRLQTCFSTVPSAWW